MASLTDVEGLLSTLSTVVPQDNGLTIDVGSISRIGGVLVGLTWQPKPLRYVRLE